MLFCLADVCKILALPNSSKIAHQIKEEFEVPLELIPMATHGGLQKLTFITEQQLYFVLFRSRARVAHNFRQWIFDEVIPAMRKRSDGVYLDAEQARKLRGIFGYFLPETIQAVTELNSIITLIKNSRGLDELDRLLLSLRKHASELSGKGVVQ